MKTAIIEKISEIAHHYGFESQARQTAEECAELIQALMKYFRGDSVEWQRATKEHILEETADVWIMIRQMWELMDVGYAEITEIVERKVDRQIQRIKSEEFATKQRHRRTPKIVKTEWVKFKEPDSND